MKPQRRTVIAKSFPGSKRIIAIAMMTMNEIKEKQISGGAADAGYSCVCLLLDALLMAVARIADFLYGCRPSSCSVSLYPFIAVS